MASEPTTFTDEREYRLEHARDLLAGVTARDARETRDTLRWLIAQAERIAALEAAAPAASGTAGPVVLPLRNTEAHRREYWIDRRCQTICGYHCETADSIREALRDAWDAGITGLHNIPSDQWADLDGTAAVADAMEKTAFAARASSAAK